MYIYPGDGGLEGGRPSRPHIKMNNNSMETKAISAEHHENSPTHLSSGQPALIDENLFRAENEDKITPYFIFLVSIAAVAGFLFGYGESLPSLDWAEVTDTAIVGSALPMVGNALGVELTAQRQEIMTAGTTIGAIFGALILGSLADRLGRKWAMAIADIA